MLTAETGYSVDLYGFDLAGWPTTDYTIDSVSVSADTGTLFSLPNAVIEGDAVGPGHTAFTFGTPLSAAQLRISIAYGRLPSSAQDNIGIDNIRFGQTPGPGGPDGEGEGSVPEPAVWQLVGLGIAAWRGRRLRLTPPVDRGTSV